MPISEALKRRKRRFSRSLCLGIVVSVLLSLFSYLGYLDPIEAKALDLLMRLRGQQRSPEIVLIKIDDQAFANLGEKQPLPRSYVASLIDIAAHGGAKVIALDIEFKVPTDPGEDEKLLQSIERAQANGVTKVVSVYVIRPVKEDENQAVYRRGPFFDSRLNGMAGFANAPIDADGFVRQVPLAVRSDDGNILPSLALAVLASHAGYDSEQLGQELRRSGLVRLNLPEWQKLQGKLLSDRTSFEFTLNESWKINFAGGLGSFVALPSEPLVQLARANVPLATDNPFRGKIVLIGAAFQESRDYFTTPYGLMTGLEIHANIIHTLLTRSQIRPAREIVAFIILLLFAFATSLLMTFASPRMVLILSFAAIPTVLMPLSYLAYAVLDLWVDFVTPFMAIGIGALVAEYWETRHLRQSLREFVGWEVANQIVQQDESLQGQKRQVSVFFTDVRDFTTLCEGATPDYMANMMRELFAMMGKVFNRHGGHILDFIGDAVFAIFGAPKNDPRHAHGAVRSALEVIAGLDELNSRWEKRGMPRLRIGIGIHSGEVFIGIVGTGQRKKFDVTGDTVNTGSRVEGLNKEFGTTILITRETMHQLDGSFVTKARGEAKVKGKEKPVEVFEVLAAKTSVG